MEGDFVEIRLEEGLHAYGRILESPTVAFYDAIGAPLENLDVLLQTPVLFKIWVMKYSFKEPHWKLVGSLELEPELTRPLWFFKRDCISGALTLYSSDSGEPVEKKATRKQCQGLECAAVWSPPHIEQRLLDHHRGVPNKWVTHFNSFLK